MCLGDEARSCRRWRDQKTRQGITLVEMVLALAMFSLLSSAVLVLRTTVERRTRELLLKETLREIRRAIDRYRDAHSRFESNPLGGGFHLVYPDDWQDLVEAGLLRRVPLDPITQRRQWRVLPFTGLVSGKPGEEPIRQTFGLFDVRSLSEETALDGTRYDDW